MTTQELYDSLAPSSNWIKSGTRVLAPALFDELKKQADAAGGIGHGTSYGKEPRCIGNFAAQIDQRAFDDTYAAGGITSSRTPSIAALITALGDRFGDVNDLAVQRINDRKGLGQYGYGQPRVTFDELVAELGLVRGEA